MNKLSSQMVPSNVTSTLNALEIALTSQAPDRLVTQAEIENAVTTMYNMMRTGKVYQTKLYKYATNPTPGGLKLLDNAELICEPSTDTVEGTDDYASIPLFKWMNVNYIRDQDGTARPTAIEGSDNYSTTGNVDVGVMQMSFYWKVEDVVDAVNGDYQLWTISDSPHPELGLTIWPECKKADGTILPWCIGSKYFAGTASDNKPRSQPGLQPIYNCSHNNIQSSFQTKGTGYWGAGIERAMFFTLFYAIKYAAKNSQGKMYGCASYDRTATIALGEENTTRVLLATTEDQYFPVGNAVAIGTSRTQKSYKILSKSTVTIEGTDYLALNLNLTTPITTVTGSSKITTMPLFAGDTDTVIGKHDGSRLSYSDGKHTLRIQGREYMPGIWMTVSNVVWKCESDYTMSVYVAPKGVPHTSITDIITSTYTKVADNVCSFLNNSTHSGNFYIGDIGVDMNTACWYPTVTSSGDSVGWCDYMWHSNGVNSWYEWLSSGHLGNGSCAGSLCMYAPNALSNSFWYIGCAD